MNVHLMHKAHFTLCNGTKICKLQIEYGIYWPEQGFVVYGDIKVALLDTETHDAFVKRIFGITYQVSV